MNIIGYNRILTTKYHWKKVLNLHKISKNHPKTLKKHAKVQRIHKIQDILTLLDNLIIMKRNEYSFNYFRTKIQFS